MLSKKDQSLAHSRHLKILMKKRKRGSSRARIGKRNHAESGRSGSAKQLVGGGKRGGGECPPATGQKHVSQGGKKSWGAFWGGKGAKKPRSGRGGDIAKKKEISTQGRDINAPDRKRKAGRKGGIKKWGEL